VIHGVAGHKEYKLKERVAFIKDLLTHCKNRLQNGETGLEVVHFAIKEMEDSGLFNAGSFIMSPHSNDFNHFFVIKNLIDQPVLYIYSPGKGPG